MYFASQSTLFSDTSVSLFLINSNLNYLLPIPNSGKHCLFCEFPSLIASKGNQCIYVLLK